MSSHNSMGPASSPDVGLASFLQSGVFSAWKTVGALLVFLFALGALSRVNYLLFHTVAEGSTVLVAVFIFLIGWKTYEYSRDDFLLFLACGYWWVGFLDALHTLAYKGMTVLPTADANVATQFWLAGRSVETATLFAAPLFLSRRVRPGWTLAGIGAASVGMAWSIFAGRFPTAFLDGQGLTTFKISTEAVVVVVLIAASVHLVLRQGRLAPRQVALMSCAIAFTVLAELAFTSYSDVYDWYNAAGHLLKMVSFYFVFLAVVSPSLERPFVMAREERVKRKREEAARFESEHRYRQLFEGAGDAILVVSRQDRRILEANPRAATLLGVHPTELDARNVLDFVADADRELVEKALSEVPGEHSGRFEAKWRGGGDVLVPTEISVSAPLFDGEPAWLWVIRDLTERRSLEAQLLHAQKMEIVGQLAGGIAHDVNNCLGVIIGSLELLELSHSELAGGPLKASVDAAERCAGLTRRLLDFSRNDVQNTEPSDANSLILGMEDFLKRSITEGIEISYGLDRELWQIDVEPDAFESAVLNLSINARDAMPSGGKMRIATANRSFQNHPIGFGQKPLNGEFVEVSVLDTGHGMGEEVLDEAFEPFFTTKMRGKGTGLGLSVVRSFARRLGGGVTAQSLPGRGSTFRIYLPRLSEVEQTRPESPPRLGALPCGSNELILVVDAEMELARITASRLQGLGYSTRIANSYAQAIAAAEANDDIALVLADLVMPDGDGLSLAREVRELRDQVGFLLTSGLNPPEVNESDRAAMEVSRRTLRKPYSLEELAWAVHDRLDASRGEDGGPHRS